MLSGADRPGRSPISTTAMSAESARAISSPIATRPWRTTTSGAMRQPASRGSAASSSGRACAATARADKPSAITKTTSWPPAACAASRASASPSRRRPRSGRMRYCVRSAAALATASTGKPSGASSAMRRASSRVACTASRARAWARRRSSCGAVASEAPARGSAMRAAVNARNSAHGSSCGAVGGVYAGGRCSGMDYDKADSDKLKSSGAVHAGAISSLYLNLNWFKKLGVLPPPLWGRVGEGGGAVMHRRCLTQSPPPPAPPHKGEGSRPNPLHELASVARAYPSRRQERTEAAGHSARADARGIVDQALAREPGLEFRRRAALQEIAHGERVVERRALIAEHDVVGAGHAHHEVDAGCGEQGEQRIHVVLVGLGVIGVADVAAHGQAEELAAEMILEPGADDLLAVVEMFRPDEAHDGVDEERRERARHRVGAGLERLLVDAVVRAGGERAALPGLEIHHVVADGAAVKRQRGRARLGEEREVDAEAPVGGLAPRDRLEHEVDR